MSRTVLAVLLIAGIARAEPVAPEAPKPEDTPFHVIPVAWAESVGGERVGPGCWMSEADCQAKAKEQRALRETIQEAEEVPAPAKPSSFWTGVILLLAGAGAGFAVGMAVK